MAEGDFTMKLKVILESSDEGGYTAIIPSLLGKRDGWVVVRQKGSQSQLQETYHDRTEGFCQFYG